MSRKESDFLGEVELDDDNYFGVQTKRALNNFDVSGQDISQFPEFINAFAKIKKASALANLNLGGLKKEITDAICYACDQVLTGKYNNQFKVDPIQGGAGTSTNMNSNEVITNIALEYMGKKKGDYDIINPNDHVNMGQSTNDTYPSSRKVATVDFIDKLIAKMTELQKSFLAKAEEYKNVFKVGRTQLQDAVPMTYGQWFTNYSNQVALSISFLQEAKKTMFALNMGATAIGTGITALPGYKEAVNKSIKEVIGKDFYVFEDLFVGTQDASSFACVSGAIKRFALQLSKICNDLRLLSSGPRAGLGDITLPAMQPGSTIMPGKVNPVIPEVVNQVCFQVVGFDTAIAFCIEGGQLELNAFEPLIAFNLFSSCNMLVKAMDTLITNCIKGIKVNLEKNEYHTTHNISIVTALKNEIGYRKCAEVAREALSRNKSVAEIVLEHKLVPEKRLKELLDLNKMI